MCIRDRGQVIKGMRRENLVISSKVFWGGDGPNDQGLSRKHIIEGCHNSLKRLGLDYLDLFFCHRPDFNTPVEETVRAMDDLIHQGKILYWGTSEWPADRIMAAYSACLLYTSDAADERSSVDLGGRRIIKKKNSPGYLRMRDSMLELTNTCQRSRDRCPAPR